MKVHDEQQNNQKDGLDSHVVWLFDKEYIVAWFGILSNWIK